MSSVENGVVVVTGGSSGIGERTAIEFAAEGAQVVVADVNEDGGTETVATIEDEGGTARFVRTDVTDPDDTRAMVEAAFDAYGRLDYAFNNAGVDGELLPVTDYPDDDWDRVVSVNLSGVFNCMKAELNRMQKQDSGGVIVNNASVFGKVGFANSSAYVAAKHGVLGLTKTAALENGETGVRINAICPGFIDTELMRESLDDEAIEQVKALHPVDRLGTKEEVADAVLWLCSDGASFVTGEALDVDGGYLSR
ncbi:MAG: glucose 1-dehydrogenase [Halovenus sp.]